MVRFYPPERVVLKELWESAQIQTIVKREDGKKKTQELANELAALFKPRWTRPYPGETDQEFKKRKRNMKKAQKETAAKVPAETLEEYNARVAALPKVREMPLLFASLTISQTLYNWVAEKLHQLGKRELKAGDSDAEDPVVPVVPIVPLPQPRAPRKLTAVQMYMKTAPRESPSSGRFDLPDFVAKCKSQFADFTSEEVAAYEAQAFNDKLSRAASTQRHPDGGAPVL